MKRIITKIQRIFWNHLMKAYKLNHAKKANHIIKKEKEYSNKHIRVLKALMMIYNRQQEYQMRKGVPFRVRKSRGIVADMKTIKNYMHVISRTALPSDHVIRQILIRLKDDGVIDLKWVGRTSSKQNRHYKFKANLNKVFKARWSWNK